MGLGARVTLGLAAMVAGLAALIYAYGALGGLAYPAAESTHLIRALYGKAAADAQLGLAPADDLAFSLVIRGVTYLTQSLTPWLRLLGGAAYLAGIALAFQASRRNMPPPLAAAVLLLALAYPFHRFAFAALPDGWYVAVLSLTVLATARLYLASPLIHGVVAGCLVGVLTMLKPQGLAVGGAFVVLALFDLTLGRRSWRAFAGRLVALAAGFFLTVNALQLLAGRPVSEPLGFFLAGHFDVGAPKADAAWAAAARSLAAMICGAGVLAVVPALTGLLRIELRWLWTRRRARFLLEPQETTFLFTLLCLVLTIALTAALALEDGGERMHGRQFEALIPLLWLAAVPFIGEFETGGGRWWRRAVAAAPLVGLAGLIACLLDGPAPEAWDAAALSAFHLPLAIPFAAGAAVIIGASIAVAVTAQPVWRIWLVCAAALAVLAGIADVSWREERDLTQARLARELEAADALISGRPGDVALLAAEPASARFAYLKLRGRPVVVARGADERLKRADLAVALADEAPDEGHWRTIFKGETLSIFTR